MFVSSLNVASSYANDIAEDVGTGTPDTMQWWIGSTESFRIRTYALDHDIHVHGMAAGGPDIVDLARGNAERTYADLITMQTLIVIDDPEDDEAIADAFRAAGLDANVEIADRFLFWLPDHGGVYRSKSEPVHQGPSA